jgi:hypothetical protein
MANVVDWSNFPKAIELLEAALSGKYKIIFYGGAIRGGKSFNGLAVKTILLRRYPGSRLAIVRANFKRLVDNTLPTCKKVFPSNFMKLINASRYVWKADCKQYGAELDSEAFFFGENIDKDKELQRFDGLEVNYFFLDQIEELSLQGFSKCIERVGSYFIPGENAEQPKPLIICTLNPANNWVRSLIYERYLKGRLPEDWLYIPAKITDNPFVPKAYLENLEQLRTVNPTEYERRVNGSWDYASDPSAIVDQEALSDMFTNEFLEVKYSKATRYISADVARFGRDASIIVVWQGLQVIHLEKIKKAPLDEFSRRLKFLMNKFNIPRRRVVVDSDGVGAGPVDSLKVQAFVNGGAALGTVETPQGKNIPANKFYANLKTQCCYLLAEKIRQNLVYWPCNDEGLLADAKEEIGNIREKYPGTDKRKQVIGKEQLKLILGRSPDISDAFHMRMYFELKPSGRIKAKAT